MKTTAFFAMVMSLVLATSAFAYPRRAECVGGPRVPSYAYNRPEDAQRCAQVIASQSRACRQAVRAGVCRTDDDNVDAVNPNDCLCNNGGRAVGYWD